MAATRALLFLFTSAFLLFSLCKLTPLSQHSSPITHQAFQAVLESLTIFKSNQIRLERPSTNILSPISLVPAPDSDDIVMRDDLGQDQGWPVIDETDVVVLTDKNFSEFVDKNRYVMVVFSASWCYWSQKLAPEYAAAAAMLKGEAVLARVDASQEIELRFKYHIQAYPTMHFFVDGVKRYPYDPQNERTRDAIKTWVKGKMAIGFHRITTMDEAKWIRTAEPEFVLGFLDSLEGTESEELAAASRLQSGISIYQTASANVAELFLIDPQIKRPALILKRRGKYYRFDGEFTRLAIADFVSTRMLPPVITYTCENASTIFKNPLKQLWLFASTNSSEVICAFEEAAEAFRGMLLFVCVNNESVGKKLAYEFGVTEDAPTVVAYNTLEAKKYVFNGELTLNNIKFFAEDFLKDELLRQSDPASDTVLKLPSQSHSSHQLHLHM